MANYHGIPYPVPHGNPTRSSDMEYTVGTDPLPLEARLLECLYQNSTLKLENPIDDIKVFGRSHTVVGHYSEFAPQPRKVPSNSEDNKKDEATFYIDDCKEPFGAIFYIYYSKVDCIEIYQFGQDFPADGITRSVTAISFYNNNLQNWQ